MMHGQKNMKFPWRWCINTETCHSNFSTNLRHLFVHTLVYNKHSVQITSFFRVLLGFRSSDTKK